MIQIISTFLSIWVATSIIAMALILFRSDAYEVWEDIISYTRKRKPILKLIGIVLLVCVLPFSIPYSISNIIKRR
jgi:hypothetical protein